MSKSGSLELPICVSCKYPILPLEKGVNFPCPNCGYMLWRDKRCRKLATSYKCPNCGFEGP
ncbi:MAG: zinc finger domain-containing protein [archaeon GBS-70-058]|uniref:zinc finger domain-containing protein n=1 Tax=Candidatus Culexarchaeum yellowstonense TaxID=2928963 RepID=UPI001771E857|nr:zinc finger domain-containing protein [Candidatus Verstraetearchaeota archaeon]MCR6623370.1 zinc finger domain-containing protein [Candidatus Culexarchaeum yellowstonense]MCS7368264.1 zinc finger domain-containing protein [Candidatus Culexarchaeum nevadense]MCR6669079.1 zinc finger domain-containing protein [Candidatus Culexarchaeum yellowstonense]MCR6690981.1 zinc finger domain-containing protein [Candidatus Culexarchaeum yellowstonense]